MAIEETVQQIIDNAQEVADTYSDAAKQFGEDAVTAGMAGYFAPAAPGVSTWAYEAPPYKEGEDLATYWARAFDEIWPDLTADLRNMLDTYLNDYFPLDACIQPSSDAWICDVINGNPAREIGLPNHVAQAMWQRGRENIVAEGQSAESKVMSQFAMSGFTMPTGVLAAQLDEVRQAQDDKLLKHTTDVTIEVAKIKVDVTKFAVEQAVRLRLGIADAVVGLVNAYVGVYKAAADAAAAQVEAKQKMYNSAAAWISAMASRASALGGNEAAAGRNHVGVINAESQAWAAKVNSAVQGAAAASRAMGAIASAALGAQHTMGSLNKTETKSGK
jgi:hypothetical protein